MSEATRQPDEGPGDALWCSTFAAAFVRLSRTNGTPESDRDAARLARARAYRACKALAAIEPPFPPTEDTERESEPASPPEEFSSHWKPHAVRAFAGPAELGRTRACLQIGDDLRLSRLDAERLIQLLTDWCDAVDLAEVKAHVMAHIDGGSP